MIIGEKMIDTILFDLDGTLLPLDMDNFMKAYFSTLAKKTAPLGYEPKSLIKGIWAGTEAMVRNDGSKTNEEAFWARFAEIFGEKVYSHMSTFDDYYENEFDSVINACEPTDRSAKIIKKLKERGFCVVLATNPIFPSLATKKRAKWAGLDLDDFALVTTYDNSGFCKPNPKYYEMILEKIGKRADQCLMVGNDATEDVAAKYAGIEVFLLTDHLINKENIDINEYENGGFDALEKYLDALTSPKG